MQERLEGSYCPLCGERNLFVAEKDGKRWAYCARLGDTLESSHTSFVIGAVKPHAKPIKEE